MPKRLRQPVADEAADEPAVVHEAPAGGPDAPRAGAVARPRPHARAAPAATTRRTPPRTAPPPAGTPVVTIASSNGAVIKIETGKDLQRAAMHWSWVVRNRDRWCSTQDGPGEQRQRARDQLHALGADLGALDELGTGDLVQVTAPWIDEQTAWEARIFPWEYVLSAASTSPDAKRRPWIIRRLVVGDGVVAEGQAAVTNGAIVVSAPGKVRERYNFDSEQLLVRSNLPDVRLDTFSDLAPPALRAALAAAHPGLIHLAGVDSHQGAALLGLPDADKDGYLLVNQQGGAVPFAAGAVGDLVATDTQPRMVACSFWNSAPRTAAQLVASGAEAAIGFQDQVDDSLAELFFATFYRQWQMTDWRTTVAFERTLGALKALGASLRGTGVVMWTRRDALAEQSAAGSPPSSQVAATVAPRPTLVTERRAATRAVSDLSVEVRPLTQLNYSLLHNDRPMFDAFRLRKQLPEPITGIGVEVVLYVGGDSYPFRRTVDLVGAVLDLSSQIRVPLTSSVLRSFRESVQSVLYVAVRVGDTMIHEETTRVTLQPIEEWREEAGGIWLPSFVLPRDPAVSTIVDAAYPLARVLRDDGKAAFDGYQSINDAWADPYRYVDAQVRALWSVITYQFDLRYINPPPTYAERAQRLRTPTEVLRTRSGTCIDLALLLAACLEYIDIYPVIFLLPGHALPGYWLGNAKHADFLTVGHAGTDPAGVDDGEEQGVVTAIAPPDTPWLLSTPDRKDPVYRELRARLNRPDIVALETVGLTDGTSFLDAQTLARQSLDEAMDAMIDIRTARIKGITPLPTWSD